MVPLPRGKYGSRAQAIKARVRQVYELEKKNKDVVAFLIGCMELVAEHPEVLKELKKFLKRP